MLSDLEAKGLIRGCKIARNAPSVSHLLFADDSLLFFKANMVEAQYIQQCLLLYEKVLG